MESKGIGKRTGMGVIMGESICFLLIQEYNTICLEN
jgi:hypothetical protein